LIYSTLSTVISIHIL